jgi:hypothetical protein
MATLKARPAGSATPKTTKRREAKITAFTQN